MVSRLPLWKQRTTTTLYLMDCSKRWHTLRWWTCRLHIRQTATRSMSMISWPGRNSRLHWKNFRHRTSWLHATMRSWMAARAFLPWKRKLLPSRIIHLKARIRQDIISETLWTERWKQSQEDSRDCCLLWLPEPARPIQRFRLSIGCSVLT